MRLYSRSQISLFFGQGCFPNTVFTLFYLTRCDYLSDCLEPWTDECLSNRGVLGDLSLRWRETVRKTQRWFSSQRDHNYNPRVSLFIQDPSNRACGHYHYIVDEKKSTRWEGSEGEPKCEYTKCQRRTPEKEVTIPEGKCLKGKFKKTKRKRVGMFHGWRRSFTQAMTRHDKRAT